ncbi:MAG: hypothetical protein AB7G22_04460 [Flavobacteriales bacterium]
MTYLFPFHKIKSLFLLVSFFSVFLLFSCSSLPQDSPRIIKKYAVGQGGGFTGEYTEFSFSEDGKVYKRDFNNQRDVFYKQLNEADLNYFLNKIADLAIQTTEMNYPGNISKYIEIREGETTLNKIVWGANNYNPPLNIDEFHKELYLKLSAFE